MSLQYHFWSSVLFRDIKLRITVNLILTGRVSYIIITSVLVSRYAERTEDAHKQTSASISSLTNHNPNSIPIRLRRKMPSSTLEFDSRLWLSSL